MPSYKDFYGSSFLSAKALGKRVIKGKILAIAPETMEGRDGKSKNRLCLTVSGEEKLIPLNATNADALGKKWGENFDKWKGRTVTIRITGVKFGDRDVDGLLVVPS